MSSGASAETWSERLHQRQLRQIALGLVLGAIGGAVADYFEVPLAWMLGALFVTMVARVGGAPIWVRAIFLILIGLFLGENFEGVDASEFLQWPISIAVAMLYVPVAAACAFAFYHYVAREEKATALCSSIPGGLVAVVVISSSLGADERQVALAKLLRIAIVVCMAPAVAFGLLHYPTPTDAIFEGKKLILMADPVSCCRSRWRPFGACCGSGSRSPTWSPPCSPAASCASPGQSRGCCRTS